MPTETTYTHEGLTFTITSDGTFFDVRLDGRYVGQLVRPRTYSREGWTFTTTAGKLLTKHAFIGDGTASRIYSKLMKWNGGCSCSEMQLDRVGCDCPASVMHPDHKPVQLADIAPHARAAKKPEQIAKLDDESVRLRYRQLVARLHATGRGGDELIALRDAFHAEATKRGII